MNTPLPRGHEIYIFGRGLPDLHNYAFSAEVKKKIVAGTLYILKYILKSWDGGPESYSSVHAKNLRFTATILFRTV